MTNKELLQYCNEYLSYNADSGVLRWIKKKKSVTNNGIAGTIANNGYRIITFNGKKHLAHRLIFLMSLGYMPKYVDHINGNKLDNRDTNLRECTAIQNCSNRGTGKNNTSGYKGVTWDKSRNKWKASIKVNYKLRNLGRFISKRDAARAYNAAALELHGLFAKLNIINT